MHNSATMFSVAGRKTRTILCAGLFVFLSVATCLAGHTKNIMLTGFWPPTNEMLRKFSTDPNQNPGGWQGQNWEGRGYDIYAYFPEFPGGTGSNPKGNGDFEIDYQDVAADFERITGSIHPVAILSYGKGTISWELEYNARNLSGWNSDYLSPFGPTPSPPDSGVPAGYIRNSTLPVAAIADAINSSGLGVNAKVDWDGDAGAFLCEYMAYYDAWYQSLHSDPYDQYQCLTAGFTHVPSSLSAGTATTVCEIALRAVIGRLDSQLISYTISGTVTCDGSPLADVIMNGLPDNPATDANGFYTAEVGAGWSGTVAPIKAGYEFDLAERTYNNLRTDQLSQDYTAYTAIPQTIEFDAASSYSSNIWSNTLSWSHAIGSGSNRALVVAVVCEDNFAMNEVISSIKYNGVDMTKVPASSKSRGYIKADLYYMLDADLPPLPGAYTVLVTYNGTVSTRVGGSVSLKNVKQQTPEAVITNSLASATVISTDINTLSDDAWIVDVAGHANNGSFTTSTSAEQWDQSSGNHTGAGSITVSGSAGSNTVSWNFSGSNATMVHSLAVFAPAQTPMLERTLTAFSTGGGRVEAPGEGVFEYGHGAAVGIAAAADANHHFVNWTGTGVAAGKIAAPDIPDTTITMDGDYTVAANFATNPYVITATADANGSINPSGQPMRDYGQDQLFTAIPNDGYTVKKWYVDGNCVQNNGSSYTLTNIQADHTIYVTFERLVSDNFDNNRLDNAVWRLFADNYENVWIVEDANRNRLNLRAAGGIDNLVAGYSAKNWRFDVAENFKFKIDFHHSATNFNDSWVGMTLENNSNNTISISAGSDYSGPYLYYEKVINGSTIFEQKSRDSNDGTLYISYNSATDQLYLSSTGYGDANAWEIVPGLLKGQWGSKAVGVTVGGGSDGGILDSGQAYLDNFEVTTGKLFGWPPPSDLNKDGLIDWLDIEIMSGNWLETGPDTKGDLNCDDKVNFVDFASLAAATK